MGITDSQFKTFIRLLLDVLDDAEKEEDPRKRAEALAKVRDILQKSLED